MNNVLLPIGSAVLLQDADTELVVIGYAGIDGRGVTHDYSGVPYPAGLATKDSIYLFDQSQIETIRYFGFSDLRAQAFEAEVLKGVQDGVVDMPLFRNAEGAADA